MSNAAGGRYDGELRPSVSLSIARTAILEARKVLLMRDENGLPLERMKYDVTGLNLHEIDILMAGLGDFSLKRQEDKIIAIVAKSGDD